MFLILGLTNIQAQEAFDLSFIKDKELKEMIAEKIAEKIIQGKSLASIKEELEPSKEEGEGAVKKDKDQDQDQEVTEFESESIDQNDDSLISKLEKVIEDDGSEDLGTNKFQVSSVEASPSSTSYEAVEESPQQSSGDFGAYVGLSGYGASVNVLGVRTDISGGSLDVGFVRNYDNGFKVRVGLKYINGSIENVYSQGYQVNLASYGLDIDYEALGLATSGSFMVSDNFGVGLYSNILGGEFYACEESFGCYQSTTINYEIGARLDFKFKAWNPYIALGYTSIYEDQAPEAYNGASAYVGLINFEF